MLTEDESTGDEADEEGEEVGNHGLGKFSEEGFDLGFEFGDAVLVGLDDRGGDIHLLDGGHHLLVVRSRVDQ